jgi:tetratricopeptide (TPR) repeat protein
VSVSEGAARERRPAGRIFVSLAALSLLAGALLLWRGGDRPLSLAPTVSAPPSARAKEALPELPLPMATDSVIAIGNLENQIHSTEDQLAKAPLDPILRPMLVTYLLAHGDYVGRIADYERADTLAEELVRLKPDDPKSYETRARTMSVFHRFDEATRDLAKAESLGAKAATLASSRSAILAARGNLDEAVAMLEPTLEPPSSPGLASLGLLYLEVGRDAEGTEALARSRKMIHDVSPFPLAWLDYHEGEVRERLGDEPRARQLYTRAHRILPTYAAAASHLAPFLGPQESAEMLENVAKTSDDPEVLAVLAVSLRKLGREDEATKAIHTAAERYDDLTKRHEAAFADHAARFWLGVGGDPERAYPLAMKNLEVRQTSMAFDLALTAALVTKRDKEGCDIAKRGLLLKHLDEPFRMVATTTVGSRACRAGAQ